MLFIQLMMLFFIIGNGGIPADPTSIDTIRPIFRTENTNTNDDYELNPASPLLDVNGSNDIGRYSGSRVSTYTIDDDCTVDYITCVSQSSANLRHLLLDNDSALLAEGVFEPIIIDRAITGAQILGAGDTTIIDAQSTNIGLALTSLDQLTVKNLKITQTDSSSSISSTITKTLFSYNGNDYDDSGALAFPADSVLLVDESPTCVIGGVTNDNDPLPIADGIHNINGGLIDFGGVYLSVLSTSTLLSICGGAAPYEVFIPDLFIANGSGGYDYNPSALATAGVTLKPGSTTPPAITTIVTIGSEAALSLEDVTNSVFENITFEDNAQGIVFAGNSDGNTILTSDLSSNNGNYDVINTGTGDNLLYNTVFNRALSAISNTGNVTVRYDTDIHVVDSLGADLSGVTVHKVSANALEDTTEVSDVNGYTSILDTLAFILDENSIEATAGGYNPYTLTADRLGQNATTSIDVEVLEQGTLELMMATVAVTPPSVSQGGGGGIPVTSGSPEELLPQDELFPPIESARSTEVITSPKVHYLVKLFDDTDPLTQQDTAIYYIGADNKRHPFPNEDVFKSWYCDYSQVKTVTPQDMAMYPIGSNITYRPGIQLVKFPENPKVYVVQPGRVLRHIADEATAKTLFGANWAKQIKDIEETLYTDYVIGDELTSFVDIEHLDFSPRHPSGEMGIEGYKSVTVKPSLYQCR